MHNLCFVLLMMLMPSVVAAATTAPAVADPALERRVQSLSEELRCLVCQNQSLADSHADLAIDLKNQVREKLRQGESEQQVIDYMVERYGDFVRYRPPVKSSTLLLWFGPGLLLIAGLGALFMRLRHANRVSVDLPLSAEEQTRAAALLNTDTGFLRRRR